MKPGVILDNRYQMVRLLGKGSMGAVWQGNDLKLNRSVAVKVVLDHTDPVLVERMGRRPPRPGDCPTRISSPCTISGRRHMTVRPPRISSWNWSTGAR